MARPAAPTAPPPMSALEIRDQLVRGGMIGPAAELDDPASTRRRILEAAIRLFADRGFDACTMRDLGREVGIKAPAIYNYYDSKEHILAAASRDAMRRFFTAVFGPLAEDPEDRRLELVVRRWVAFQIEERAIARWNDSLIDTGTLKRVLPAEEWRRTAAALRAPLKLLAELIDAPPGTDPALLAVAIAAACDRSGRRLGRDHPSDREGVGDQIWLLCRRMSAVRDDSDLATA